MNSLRRKLAMQLFASAPDQQRLRLRERIGDEKRLLVVQRMRRPNRHDELDRNLVGSLMQPLEECVLAVGARIAPQARRRRSIDRRAVALDALAVALERQLLQPRRQTRECLRIGNDDPLRVGEHGRVPPPDQSENDREIACQRRIAHMRIHCRSALEEFRECLIAVTNRNR